MSCARSRSRQSPWSGKNNNKKDKHKSVRSFTIINMYPLQTASNRRLSHVMWKPEIDERQISVCFSSLVKLTHGDVCLIKVLVPFFLIILYLLFTFSYELTKFAEQSDRGWCRINFYFFCTSLKGFITN